MPTIFLQHGPVSAIPLHVASQFGLPEVSASRRLGGELAAFMAVPEAAHYFDNLSPPGKHQVGATR